MRAIGELVASGRIDVTVDSPLSVPSGIGSGARVVRLGEGELGYCMNPARLDDCLRPCIATVLQVPVEQVPDPRLDDRHAARGEEPRRGQPTDVGAAS